MAGITIFLLSFCRQAHAPNWSTPQVYDVDISWSVKRGTDITVDPSNNWHVVYCESDVNGTLYIKYFSSTGAQGIIAQAIYDWDIEVGEIVWGPAIDADSDGGLHVIYQHYSDPGGTRTLMYTNNLSGSWSSPQAQAFDIDPVYGETNIDITVAPDNNWHVVYSTESWFGEIGTSYIKYVSSTGAQGIIAQGICDYDINEGEEVWNPTIDADSDGGLHVIYLHFSVTSWTENLMYTNNLSGTWSPPQAQASDSDGANIDITVYPNNTLHGVYHTISLIGKICTSYIHYVSSSGAYDIIAQAIWVEGEIDEGEEVFGPTIDADSDGGLHVIYQHYSEASQTYTLMYTRTKLDRDGDGLPDDWETEGIHFNDDGIIDLDLPALGADPNHKDLFVEVDAMVGRAPPQAVLNRVRDAFAAVPNDLIHNPDGLDGITLHIQLDETNIPLAPWPNAFADFDAVKAARFGTAAERGDANIKAAKALAYRYCIFGDTHSGTTSSGLAECPGNDFMVTLGAWAGGTPDQQAGTFMHEFGHNLGLDHGGADDIHYKPNYHSVMNYTWQVPESAYYRGWVLDYSQKELDPLDESDLSEPDGIGGHSGYHVPVGPPGPLLLADEKGPVDWNRDGDENDRHVQADINWIDPCDPPSPDQLLRGYNDWSNLRYSLSGHPNFEDGVHLPDTVPDEMTYEMFVQLSLIGCEPWDFNCDGSVDFDDFAILGNQWLQPPGDPSADIAPEAGDGMVDFFDLGVMTQHWLEK